MFAHFLAIPDIRSDLPITFTNYFINIMMIILIYFPVIISEYEWILFHFLFENLDGILLSFL